MYNHKVDGQIDQLEKVVMSEILGMQNDIEKEEQIRITSDQRLLEKVNEFLDRLKLPTKMSLKTVV